MPNMLHPDIEAWEKLHNMTLALGLEVKIDPAAPYYEPEYDEVGIYYITAITVNSKGIDIGLSDQYGKWRVDFDGHGWEHINPVREFTDV